MTKDTKIWFVEQVTELLRSELSVEELDMLSSDLEDQLSVLPSSEVEETLGLPEGFVDAYRITAGIEPRTRGLAWHVAEGLRSWLDARRQSALGKIWTRYQKGWWAFRGWVVMLAFVLLYSGRPFFNPIPLPTANESAAKSFMILVVLTGASMLLGRTNRRLTGRILNIIVSTMTAYIVFVVAVNV